MTTATAAVHIVTTAPTKPSFVYVLPRRVGGRKTREHAQNAAHAMLQRHRAELGPDLADALRNYEAAIDRSLARYREWARRFEQAYYLGEPLPTGRPDTYVRHGDTSAMTGPQLALWHVLGAGAHGTTVWEVKQASGRMSHAVSGAMSKLHAAGVVACLDQRR